MALTKQFKVKKLEIDLESLVATLMYEIVVLEDEAEIARKNDYLSFAPGMLSEVIRRTGLPANNRHIQYLESLWTPQAIEAYNNRRRGELD